MWVLSLLLALGVDYVREPSAVDGVECIWLDVHSKPGIIGLSGNHFPFQDP